MVEVKDYSKNQTKQSVWTKPIYIHVMPQLKRKIPNKKFVLLVSIWTSAAGLVVVYFLVK